MGQRTDALERLCRVIETLTGPDGCPWDREQTPESLCDYVIEEGFELVEAIRDGDMAEACEEVGDVLFLLLFISHLAEQRGDFDIARAMEGSSAKMIRRHPHVFGDESFADQSTLLKNWERIKREEEGGPEKKTVFGSLPKGLPPMLRAYRIHSKAARAGFTWATDADARGQLDEEWREWEQAQKSGDAEAMEHEFGDYLFTLVELGRRHGIKANAALDHANRRFLARFAEMERLAAERGQDLDDMDLDAKNALWDEAKARLDG